MSVVETDQPKNRPTPDLRVLEDTSSDTSHLDEPGLGESGLDEVEPTDVENVASDVPQPHDRVLTVGSGIRLQGEISACDTLIVEGFVDVTLANSRHLDILRGGTYCGRAEVETATVSGLFEGDLTVRHGLRITSSGQVKGTIRYGALEIDTGGELNGDVSTRASRA